MVARVRDHFCLKQFVRKIYNKIALFSVMTIKSML